jgi:glycosyltransferase involved in cell wall biosynthesis
MIRSGENGLVVPVGDSKAIADGLIALLNDDKYCTNLGEQARNDSFKYDIRRVAMEFENIYDDVI